MGAGAQPRWRQKALLVVVSCLGCGLLAAEAEAAAPSAGDEGSGLAPPQQSRPKLHLATFSDIFDPRLMLPLSSAYRHSLRPLVLGLGSGISWGTGMGQAWNTYREFVLNQTDPEDLVLLFDAYDVMFQAGEKELVDTYLAMEARTGRSLFYNADIFCSSERLSDYPEFTATPWRYLNSGIYMGRSRTLRKLFKDVLPPLIVDKNGKPKRLQNWHTDFYLDHQDMVALDSFCEFTQLVFTVEGLTHVFNVPENTPKGTLDLRLEGGKVHNSVTHTMPLMLHFPGPGHWPDWRHPERVGTCTAYEILRQLDPDMLALMEERSLNWHSGKYYGVVPWKPVCTFYFTPFDYKGFQLGHLGDWLMASIATGSVLSLIVVLLMGCLVCRRPVRAAIARSILCRGLHRAVKRSHEPPV